MPPATRRWQPWVMLMSAWALLHIVLVSALAPFPGSVATDIHAEISFGAGSLAAAEAQGHVLTASAAVTVAAGDTPFFSVRAPPGARNRWLWKFDVTAEEKSALSHFLALRSCSPSDACEHPQPSQLAAGDSASASTLYDKSAGTTELAAHMSLSTNPRSYSQGAYPFRTANAAAYPNCACSSASDTNPIHTAHETWWLRGYNKATQSASAASLITANASVLDLCNGHGTENPTAIFNGPGCSCDAGWFGSQCTGVLGLAFRPCCSDPMTPLPSAGPDAPPPADDADHAVAVQEGPFDYLRVMRSNERMFLFNASDFNVTAGVSYASYIRLRSPGDTRCIPSAASQFFFTAVCDLSQLEQCALTRSAPELSYYNGASSVSDVYTGFSRQSDLAQFASGAWIRVPGALDHNKARTFCGCTATTQENAEKVVLVKVMQAHAACSYDFKMNATEYCQNGGVYKFGRGCICAAGLGGERCENLCSPTRGGPYCNETLYEAIPGVPLTFVSGVGNRTWLSFESPAPLGRPRALRIRVQGEDDHSNPTLLRVSAVNRCSESACPIIAPANLEAASGITSESAWPFDFGAYDTSTFQTPKAFATFVAEGYASPLLAGWAATGVRSRCGCTGLNSSSESYVERWNILVLHRKGARPTNTLTVTVEALDVCNEHGHWNPATKQCTCEEGYARGSAAGLCAHANAWMAPCCMPSCAYEATTTTAGLQLNCSRENFAQLSGAVSMPVTQELGPQIPGVLPKAVLSLFPSERAVVRLVDLPQNPTGNPWAISFRATLQLPPSDYNGYRMHMGGMHTCSTAPQCIAMVPGRGEQIDSNLYEWHRDPAKQTVTMPLEFGSIAQFMTRASPLQQPLDQLKLEWNPVAAWSQADYPYAAARSGNLTSIPAECVCTPEFYSAQLGASPLTPSLESFNLASSFLQGTHANLLSVTGNYSDICAGHGRYSEELKACACESDYYGRACATPTASVTPNVLYSGNQIQAPPGPCCTARAIRPQGGTAGTVTDGRIYASTSGRTSVPLPSTTVDVIFLPQLVLAKDAPKNYYYYTQGATVIYDIDPATVRLGQSYSLRLVDSYTTVSAAQCQMHEIVVQPFLVCGHFTTAACLDEILRVNPASGSGYTINSQQYDLPVRADTRSGLCGCANLTAVEHSLVVRLQTTGGREQPCRFSLTATTPTYTCVPGRSVWDRATGACVCLGSLAGPPSCGTDLAGSVAILVPSGSQGGRSFESSTLTVGPLGYMFATIPVGNRPHALNLNVSASCAAGTGSTTARSFNFEFARCWNLSAQAGQTPANRVYSPEETLAFSANLNSFSSLATATPNNPLRHCDLYTGLSATPPLLIAREVGFSYRFTYKQAGSTVPSTFSVTPQTLSPCRPVSGIGCDTDGQYWIVKAYNTGATPCSLTVTQTKGMACEESMLSCGLQTATNGACLPATRATSTYEGKALGVGYGASCGACRPGFEGAGCHRPTADYAELVNSDVVALTSVGGERMRFSVQVSPSNDPVTLKFKFSDLNPSIFSSCPTCRFHRAPVWIRARLGRAPPALVTRVVTDEAQRTFYIASDGTDEETNTTAIDEGDIDIDPATGEPTPMSSTGAAAPLDYDAAASSSTGGVGTLSWSRVSTLARRLLSVPTHGVGDGDLGAQLPVYRNDLYATNDTIEIRLPAPGFEIYDHAFLFVDVYHGALMQAATGKAYAGEESASTTTSMTVEVSVHDALGTLVGWIALAILAGFAFVLLVYLVYLKCRYGSISDGVERSVLEKAKVQRGVAPMLSPQQMAKEAEKKRIRREKEAAKKAKAEQAGACSRSVKLVLLLFAFALLLTFELLKVLFNISILHTSVGSFLPVVDFDSVAESVEAALHDIGLWRFHQAWASFNRFFGFLGVFNDFSLKWNCGGALSMFGPVVILIGSIVLVVILQKDYFLRAALSLKGSTEGTSTLGRKIRAAAAGMLSTGLLYLLQSSILVLAQVVASTWNIKRSCSAQDKVLVDVGRILCIVFIVLLLYVAGLMFAGIKQINAHSLIAGWLTGMWALLQLSVGVWRRSTVERFDIAARARAFDIDDNHDENPEEAVMELQGVSRGLMWTAFPVGIVLTKLTEQINSPPVLLFGDNIGVTIDTPAWHRRLRWSVGMLRLAAVLYTVWRASQLVVLISFGLTALGVALSILLPSDYHKRRWQATHPEKEIEMQGVSTIVNRGPSTTSRGRQQRGKGRGEGNTEEELAICAVGRYESSPPPFTAACLCTCVSVVQARPPDSRARCPRWPTSISRGRRPSSRTTRRRDSIRNAPAR